MNKENPQAEYIEVADHFIAQQTFDSLGEVWMWPFKNDTAYEEARELVASMKE